MKIKQLVSKFEESSLTGEEFHHLEHLQVAWYYICNESLIVAKEKFHRGVLALVAKLDAEDKYHRTLTDFFLDYLAHLRFYLGTNEWSKVEAQCPLIINDAKQIIGFYYSDEVIWSESARTSFIEGDKIALDRASLKLSVEDHSVFNLNQHDSPLIVSIPHNGQFIPHNVLNTMQSSALDSADTDWYLSQLYSFLDELEVTCLSANYSRYLIDLNRDSSGEVLYVGADNTELCPTSTFESEPLYTEENNPDADEINRRIEGYWKPYHNQIEQLIQKAKEKHGYAIVFEAHSIASEVPRFFDGKLPDFNFGTNNGKTVNKTLTAMLEDFVTEPYSKIINGRFKGGFITRNYANPDNKVFTIQLELSQATYMDEQKRLMDNDKISRVSKALRQLIKTLAE